MPITNATLAQQISDLVAYWRTRDTEYAAWVAGTSTGGPYGDGRYALTDYLGNTQYVKAPAALQASVDGPVASALVYRDEAQGHATAASSAQTAAAAARDLALSYQTGAQAARDLALSYKDYAASHEANAQSYANAAAASAASADADAIAADADAVAAAASAAAALLSEQNAAASAAAAATFNPALYGALADNEVVTGIWTFKQNAIDGHIIWRNGTTGAAGIGFRNDDGLKGYVAFDDSGQFTVYNSAASGIVRFDSAGAMNLGTVPWSRLTSVPSTFAPSAHTHAIADVTGLQTALDAKAPLASPTFTGTVTGGAGVTLFNPTNGTASVNFNWSTDKPRIRVGGSGTGAAAAFEIQGAADFVRLSVDASGNLSVPGTVTSGGTAVSLAGHAHVIADVTGLQTALDGKAASTHTHVIADVTGLQTALDGKLSTTGKAADSNLLDGIDSLGFARVGITTPPDTYLYTNRTSVNPVLFVRQGSTGAIARFLTSATAGATSSTSQLDINNDGGLTATGTVFAPSFTEGGTALSSKYAAASHAHAIADVTGLQTALDGKPDAASAETISGLWSFSTNVYVTGIVRATDGTNYTHINYAGLYTDRQSSYLKNSFATTGSWYMEASYSTIWRDLATNVRLLLRHDTGELTGYADWSTSGLISGKSGVRGYRPSDLTQYGEVTGDSGYVYFRGVVAPNNAKNLMIDSRTSDATAPTAGALGIRFAINGSVVGTIDSTGNFGLGTVPSYKLHVAGTGYVSSTLLVGSTLTANSTITSSSAEPALWLDETDAAADEKKWRWVASVGTLYLQARNDANSAGASPIIVNRTGTTIDSIALTATSVTVNGTAVSVVGHTHAIADVTGLQTALDGKAATSHTHSYQPLDADLTAIAGLAGTSGFLKKTAADTWTLDTNSYSLVGHTHAISDVTGLQTALDGKSATSHTHSYLPLSGGTLTGALVTAAAGIELGHATDTTLARIAAGRMSVETREVVTLGFSASSAKITRGTAAPTGGADGDIYLQYT